MTRAQRTGQSERHRNHIHVLWYPGGSKGFIAASTHEPVNTLESTLGFAQIRAHEAVQEINEYEKETGVKVHSALETNWPTVWGPLGWDIEEHSSTTNKEFEIKA